MSTPATTVALVTARSVRGQDQDAPQLAAALDALGIASAEVAWDDGGVDWSRFALVLVRSTWDYTLRLQEFLAWAERVSAVTQLSNNLTTLRWNTDKHYMADLARAGVPVVPCKFVEPGAAPVKALDEYLTLFAASELVVKPCVSAGSRDTQRYGRDERDAIAAHIARLLDAGRSVLMQPYLERIDVQGESSLIHFDGQFSHAVRKSPLLERGRAGVSARLITEKIQPREAAGDERALAARVLGALPFEIPLYARVDMLRADDGTPVLIELELTEPSLFLKYGAGSASRWAAAVLARLWLRGREVPWAGCRRRDGNGPMGPSGIVRATDGAPEAH